MWMLIGRDLRRRWTEILLVTFAVAVVVAAVAAQRAVTRSADAAIHDLAHRLGTNVLVLPAATDLAAFHRRDYGAEAMPADAPVLLRDSSVGKHVRGIEARVYGNARVNGVPVVIVGQDVGWPYLGGPEPAVLGGHAARALGVRPGQPLVAGGTVLHVLNVTETPPDALDDAIFMPVAAAQRMLGREDGFSALRLSGCFCSVDVTTLASDVERLLPGTRALSVAGMVKAQQGSIDVMRRYSGASHALALVIVGGLVAAVVAGQARRRTREIGLLAAIGAPPHRIARLFTAQAALAGAAGGLAGWALALPAAHWLGAAVLGGPVSVPAGLLPPSVVLAALASAAAAFLPARRAAALDPTTVLRES
jgi:putative ABC transport system permease protein